MASLKFKSGLQLPWKAIPNDSSGPIQIAHSLNVPTPGLGHDKAKSGNFIWKVIDKN